MRVCTMSSTLINAFGITSAVLSAFTAACLHGAEQERLPPIRPVPFSDVVLSDAFWAPRIEINRSVSIPHCFKMCQEGDRISNFAKAAGQMPGVVTAVPWCDSDVYKIIEGASYSLRLHPDPSLEQYLADLIAKIAAAQKDDGYLYTPRTGDPDKFPDWYGKTRWSHKYSCELFNAGHLYEAAVAYNEATGSRDLLNVAVKNADLLCRVFEAGKPCLPNHAEVELALVKLHRATGDKAYLTLAKHILEDRGRGPGRELQGPEMQDHKPLSQETEPTGHAVCAFYNYLAMTDVVALDDTSGYQQALDRIWESMVARKLYLTGGTAARGECFIADYDLPNREAKCETCAALASILWNQRLFLSHGDAKYWDVAERTLYNVAPSTVSLGGDRFFYANPLAHDGKEAFNMGSAAREPWFGSACCPTFVVRFLPLIGGFAYATRTDNLYVNLFIAGHGRVRMDAGTVDLQQETRYPWDGVVKLTVQPEHPMEFTAHLRIPCWAQERPVPSDLYSYLGKGELSATLKINGKPEAYETRNGFACVRRTWNKGDILEWNLPMPIRRVVSREDVKDNTGRVALERGPIVYCVEGLDHEGEALNLALSDDAELRAEHRTDLLGGVTVLRGQALAVSPGSDGSASAKPQELTAIPYCVWANRGVGQMQVWLPREPKLTPPH